jgi:hypothetical protein
VDGERLLIPFEAVCSWVFRELYSLHDNALLPRLDSPSLHLKLVDPILLLVLDHLDLTWQLPPFSNRHKSRAETEREDRAEQEPPRIETDDHVGLGGVCGEDVVQQVGDERLKGNGVAQDGEDVEEVDPLRGEASQQETQRLGSGAGQ